LPLLPVAGDVDDEVAAVDGDVHLHLAGMKQTNPLAISFWPTMKLTLERSLAAGDHEI
jgi:hypothetical protein